MINKKRSLFVTLLNLILTLTIVFSEYIYSSYYSVFSWYENCGTQFLAILIISAPIFIILIVIYYFLSKKYPISNLNKKLPLIALLVFLGPILIDLSLSDFFITIGAILGLCLSLVSIIVLFKE